MNLRRDFVIGLTAIVALVGLAYLLLRFGELGAFTNERWALKVSMIDAGGLRNGSQVTLNGVPVGEVERIEITQDLPRPITVYVMIDNEVSLPPETVATTSAALLGGGASLTLVLPPFEQRGVGELVRDGKGEINGSAVTPFDRLSDELDRRLAGLDDALQSFRELAATWTRVGEGIEVMFDPESPNAVPATLARIDHTFETAEATLADARMQLSDDGLVGDVRATVARLDGVLDEAAAAMTDARTTVAQLRSDGGRVVEAILPVAASIQDASDDLRGLVLEIRAGEGTLGQLVSNPDLYRSLDDAARTLETTLRSVQELLETVRNEGVRIR